MMDETPRRSGDRRFCAVYQQSRLTSQEDWNLAGSSGSVLHSRTHFGGSHRPSQFRRNNVIDIESDRSDESSSEDMESEEEEEESSEEDERLDDKEEESPSPKPPSSRVF